MLIFKQFKRHTLRYAVSPPSLSQYSTFKTQIFATFSTVYSSLSRAILTFFLVLKFNIKLDSRGFGLEDAVLHCLLTDQLVLKYLCVCVLHSQEINLARNRMYEVANETFKGLVHLQVWLLLITLTYLRLYQQQLTVSAHIL